MLYIIVAALRQCTYFITEGTKKGTDLTMAASTCAIIPVVIIFMFCQRYFVEGIATSGVKG